jgi:hypothetical protein
VREINGIIRRLSPALDGLTITARLALDLGQSSGQMIMPSKMYQVLTIAGRPVSGDMLVHERCIEELPDIEEVETGLPFGKPVAVNSYPGADGVLNVTVYPETIVVVNIKNKLGATLFEGTFRDGQALLALAFINQSVERQHLDVYDVWFELRDLHVHKRGD